MNRTGPFVLLVALAVLLAACGAGEPATNPEPMATDTPMTESPVTSSPATTATAASADPAPASADPTLVPDALLAVELTDVRSGEHFTLGQLAAEAGPLLLQPMAVWCSSCLSQQREVVRAHDSGSFTSVSLDVDLSEAPEDLARYADREGFDWHFAMADAALYRALQERFGVAVTNPPSTPLIIIGADGSVRPLEFGRGVRSADDLLAELGAG
jgi:hypothetical protein